ncbi:MAG: ComEA family DNA-binding protein [Candidatus Sumerlaeaceae bacterium]|nr:ComEA family DNA-binding protein [Candidatus Sumerlaeaceae bacterium]
MWSSFTRDEKRLILFLVATLTGGTFLLNVLGNQQKAPVFKPSPVVPPKPGASGQLVAPIVERSTSGNPQENGQVTDAQHDDKINLNTAPGEVLESLPGIGVSRARQIIEYRQSHGGFGSVTELQSIKGIGPAIYSKLEPLVTVASVAQTSKSVTNLSATTFTKQQNLLAEALPTAISGSGLVNINTASVEELAALPGIGPIKASAIIDHRKRNGAFTEINKLLNVFGIGPKTLDAIRGRITVR